MTGQFGLRGGRGHASAICALLLLSVVGSANRVFAQTKIPGAIISTQNLNSDIAVTAGAQTTNIIVTTYTAENLYPYYDIIIQGVALVNNPGTVGACVAVATANSSAICEGGPGRVMNITVPPAETVAVPVSVIDFISGGNTSQSYLQILRATQPVVVKQNSYLDTIMVPTNDTSNTPNEGPTPLGSCRAISFPPCPY